MSHFFRWMMIGTLLLLTLGSAHSLSKAEPFAQLLPSPGEFRLTIREDLHGKLPLGPSCGGEAAATLTCRAFVVRVTNTGSHTVRINGWKCAEPQIRFSLFEIRAKPVFWFPISNVRNAKCDLHAPGNWINTRLRPGDHFEYATRLMSLRREAWEFQPGSHELRAEWTLWGCTDRSEADDCLKPLQHFGSASSVPDVDVQTPITVISKPIVVLAPQLPDLGTPHFRLVVTAHVVQPVSGRSRYDDCTAALTGSIDCTGFHYTARYVGQRIIRNGRMSCSDTSFSVEYRQQNTGWKPLPSGAWGCTMNVMGWIVLRPGEAIEEDRQLAFMIPYSGLSIDPLRKAGQYELRFTFHPNACVASPDGSFCLATPPKQDDAIAPVVTITTTRDAPPSRGLFMRD